MEDHRMIQRAQITPALDALYGFAADGWLVDKAEMWTSKPTGLLRMSAIVRKDWRTRDITWTAEGQFWGMYHSDALDAPLTPFDPKQDLEA
jgi:hypothetical protein